MPKNRLDMYPYDDQQMYAPVRNCPQVAKLDPTRTLEVSLNTETTYPGRFAPSLL